MILGKFRLINTKKERCHMEEEFNLDIRSLLQIIKKNILLILSITISATLLTIFVNFYVLKPLYQAKCSVIVGKETSDKLTQEEVIMYQSLIKSYTEIAESRLVAENAIESSGLKTSSEELMENISVSAKEGTQIIEITYLSKDPEDSMIKANALAMSFVAESQKLLPSGSVKLIDKAIVPKVPFSPNKILNIVISFFIGLIISLGLVSFLELLDNSIKNENDVENQLGLTTLGSIPRQNKMISLIVEKEPNSHVAEAYKTLRTNILFSLENRGIKTLMVCSSGIKEGKTNISTNLATAISKVGKSVLLIDCDLRKPSVHRSFNISNELGLSNILMEDNKANQAIVSINNNLHIMPSGRHVMNPYEVLASKKMKALIKEMEASYDYIIIDTPPIIAFTDALALVTDKIATIFVVSSGETKIDICKKSIKLLLTVNAAVIGVTLNKVNKIYDIDYSFKYYKQDKERKLKSNFRGDRKRVNKGKSMEVNNI
jgi:capsular exopolysaccharide synthesis family protein